jgi:carbonic anhydrase/acetyltransferase-like protein (isoleucine patch superfamily)
MAQLVPFVHIPGMLLRDAAARLIFSANLYISRRELPPVMRHQKVRIYRGLIPLYQDAEFIAPNAQVWGNVILGHHTCLFYHSYIRNFHLDTPTIIGDNTVIADRTSFMGQIKVGHDSFIGVGCSLDMCEVMNNVYVSHGCSIQLGCVVEDGAVLALGTNLEKDTRVKANEYWAGNPGRFVCHVDENIRERVDAIAAEYRKLGHEHAAAIDAHINEGLVLDEAWLKNAVAKMEARRSDVAIPVKRDVPSIAKRFIQPRVTARLPQFHAKVSYPQNRMAPWKPNPPDNNGNA